MNETSAVLRETRAGLTILRLNQPERMNALSADIKGALAREIPDFMQDPSARCLLITGTDKAFCAGGDIRNMVGEQNALEVRERLAASHENWARHLLLGDKPVIMAVNGPAVGAGFALAMLGDLIIASESAYFLAGFSAIGAAADMGLGATLPRAVGMPRAKDILFTNRRVSA
jgi:2-(1,2-epoxy-1,2-dihydrophenyl)acetyl-CoA isomerase